MAAGPLIDLMGMTQNRETFPVQPPIDAYGDGGFRIAGRRMTGSVLLMPSGIYPWPGNDMTDLDEAALAPILAAAAEFDILLFGCGARIVRPTKPIQTTLSDGCVACDYLDTGAACRTYNVLLAENRLVAAALIAV